MDFVSSVQEVRADAGVSPEKKMRAELEVSPVLCVRKESRDV